MQKPILVRGAKQLLTLRGPDGMRRGHALRELSVIEDGSLLIQNGLIEQVGSTRRLENLKESRYADELDASGFVVMPAFVDPAIYLPVSETVNKRRRVGEFSDRTISLIQSCLQHGTLHGQATIGLRDAGAPLSFSLMKAFARNDKLAFRPTAMWHIDEHDSAFDATRADEIAAGLTRSYLSGFAQGVEVGSACHPALRDKVWAEAAAQGIPIRMVWLGGSDDLLAELWRRARPRTIYCPCLISQAESRLLGSTGTPLIFSPADSLDAGTPPRVLQQWIEAGSHFALASGYREPSWPVFSMQTAVSLAVLKLGLTVEQAISAATVNAAWSIGAGLRTGTLEAGKNADILLLQVDDYRELPRNFGANLVRVAMRAGRIVFEARKASPP